MTLEHTPPETPRCPPAVTAPLKAKERPEWADGLRKLYDSVVDEPLPDSFRDLLDKLDKQD